MPTYVYKFIDTDETIEVQQSFTDATLTEYTHPDTGANMPVKKVFLPVGVTFKGDGFYKTDSRQSKKPSGSKSSGGDGSSSADGPKKSSEKSSDGSKGSSDSAGSASKSDAVSSSSSSGSSSSGSSGSSSD